ncbi:FKBP-type peptidyl-prolyl cis-trans isomerase [Rhodohalobacter halophilus]|uniref:FKBP-type peptidyl-prolyl cis-trans isomerase n=1 Tax=Rhodohalobacter halophilus TaxID=1812810 RepID=UPI00083F74C3|nr:FKBP-type peptidyl-prolyl cis-trans isomerase [Rhodohalobacter halophilus]
MKLTPLKIAIGSVLLFFSIASCDNDDPFYIPPPDFSTVPAAYDYEGLEAVEIEEGITAYIHEEGDGVGTVTVRDDILLFITLRTLEGDIIYSTYNDSSVEPTTVRISNIQLNPSVFRYNIQLAYTYGLRQGVIGMKEGERRTLIVQPEQGFADLPNGTANEDYKNSVLQYDLIVLDIID